MLKDNMKNISYGYILIPILLSIIGIIFIFSTGISPDGTNSLKFVRQLIWMIVGLGLAAVFLILDYYQFVETAEYFYIAGVILLIVTLIFGSRVRGAKSWLGIGSLGIQPSEFMKVFYILLFAKFLARAPEKEKHTQTFAISVGMLAIPLGLIMLQPDLGTAIVYIMIFLVMCYMGLAAQKYVIFVGLIAIIISIIVLGSAYYHYYYLEQGGRVLEFFELFFSIKPMIGIAITLFIMAGIALLIDLFRPMEIISKIYPFLLIPAISFTASSVAMKLLKPYQWKRLLVFLNPEFDRWGAGYNIIQSKIAIGSGGFWGKGVFRGTQNTLGFLPEKDTDFIFSIICEELGFLGSGIIIGLFVVYFFLIIRVVNTAKDKEGMLIASGILAMFFTHFIINIGMTLGVAPATGLPLPFISYGGSSYLAFIVASALVSNIYSRRFLH